MPELAKSRAVPQQRNGHAEKSRRQREDEENEIVRLAAFTC